jgi:serine/threonine protein kinase
MDRRILVGTGCFAHVWCVVDPEGNRIAEKRYYRTDTITTPQIEYKNRMSLKHKEVEGIITYHKLTLGTIHMDYYPYTLKSLLTQYCGDANKNIRLELFSHISRQLLYGLIILYNNNCCHADIAPKNILIDISKNIDNAKIKAVIADFGSMIKIDNERNSIKRTNLKNKEIPHSTHIYASPEVRNIRFRYTLVSDVYSLGVCLIEFLFDMTDYELENIRVNPHHLIKCKYTNLLQKMIEPDYTKRLSPCYILEFLQN